METVRFEIMYEDLSIDAQIRLLKFLRIDSFENSNLEIAPIATIEIESDGMEEEDGK